MVKYPANGWAMPRGSGPPVRQGWYPENVPAIRLQYGCSRSPARPAASEGMAARAAQTRRQPLVVDRQCSAAGRAAPRTPRYKPAHQARDCVRWHGAGAGLSRASVPAHQARALAQGGEHLVPHALAVKEHERAALRQQLLRVRVLCAAAAARVAPVPR